MNRQEQYQNALVDTNKEFFITLIEGIILSTIIWMVGKNEIRQFFKRVESKEKS